MPYPARVASIMAAFPQYGTHRDIARLPLRTGLALEQQAARLRMQRIHDQAIAMRLAQLAEARDFEAALREMEV